MVNIRIDTNVYIYMFIYISPDDGTTDIVETGQE